MLKAEEVSVQSYATLSLAGQAMHVKRLWLYPVAFGVYYFYGFPYAVVAFFILLFLVSRISPLRVRDKDGMLYYIIMRFVFLFVKKGERLTSKWLSYFVNALCMLFILVGFSFSQDPLLMLKQDNLKKLIKELEKKEKIIRQQEGLIYGGEKNLYLRGVNHFDYHPDLPVLFIFDRKVRHVLMYTESAKAVFEDNVVFLGPPSHEDGRVFGFVVILEDGNAYYFAGRKVSINDKEKQAGVYYRFITPQGAGVEDVVVSFLKAKGRCPMDNEVFSVEGKMYKFVKLKEQVVRDRDELFCDGAVYKLVAF